MALRYIIFNKPDGVLSQFTDEGTGHATLKDFIPVPNVYAAGRLDRDSEGLLLLTDDGPLIRQIADPRGHLEKTYCVQIEGDPTDELLERLRRGVRIKAHDTLPCGARRIDDPGFGPRSRPVTPHGPTAWIEIRLREGKKHQVRHMTAAVGLFTLRLVRVAIGPVGLGSLQPGQWRDLTSAELGILKATKKA